VCGNPVIVKPHPHAVLPLAITVRECRETLSRYGFPPDLVTLAVEADGDRLAAALALRPEIRLIDYTGSTSFGRWLEDNARQAVVFAEKSGVNAVLLESTADFDGMVSNLASSLALYSGQMCTTPRVLFVPREGIETDQGRRGLDDILASLDAAFRELADDPRRAVALLGAIVDERVERAVDTAMALPNVVIPSRRVSHPEFPRAVVRTPVVVRSDVEAAEWRREWFGPIAFAVPTESADDSVRLWEELATSVGSLTASVYSTNKSFLDQVEQVAATTGVLTALNFTGDVLVNQTVAFADFHGSGANPAANAALVDFGFVAPRFHAAEIRERW
ncbi:MAG: aldehyde dehydrogenase family protein, partial [Acidothermus sp.]|nr:aldehyde dehydrogenase family protein [Acidothermus sp.]